MVNVNGSIRTIAAPSEAEGLKLLEITKELEWLINFESFIELAKQNSVKHRMFCIEKFNNKSLSIFE